MRAGALKNLSNDMFFEAEIAGLPCLDIAGVSYSDDEFGLDKASQAQRQQIGV